MNTEKAKQLMTGLGLPEEVIQGLSDENFNVQEAVDQFTATQTELFLANHKGKILERYKQDTELDRFLAYEKPNKARLKRSGLFSEEELKKTTKELLELLPDRLSSKVKAESSKDLESHLQEKRNLQDQFDQFVAAKDAEVEKWKQELEEATNKASREIENFKVTQFLTGLYHDKESIQFDQDEKIPAYAELLTPKILAMAKIDPSTGAVVSLDGTTKVVKPDGKGFYNNVKEIVSDLADHYKMKKQSNGGLVDPIHGKRFPKQVNGKEVDRTASSVTADLLGL